VGAWVLALAGLPGVAAAQECQLCAPDAAAAAKKVPATPITIQVETRIDYAMIGLVTRNQGGTAEIDPDTGIRRLTGSLIDLGGLPITGTVLIRGQPNEHVVVTMPGAVGLANGSGQSYPLTDFTTTLKNNPKLAKDGTLRFTFGGLLRIDGTATGTFRGSIPITIEYR
jgi:hypothetical protein